MCNRAPTRDAGYKMPKRAGLNSADSSEVPRRMRQPMTEACAQRDADEPMPTRKICHPKKQHSLRR